jgi:hypothetical protein
VHWPIRLGDRRANNDGLVGFFAPKPGGDLTHRGFFPASGRTLGRMSDRLSKEFKEQTDLVIDAVRPWPLVLLMDPLAPVHATSGALPVTTFELPPRLSSGSRRAREVYFQTAPVLGFGEQPEMPRPSDDYGEWSWFWRPAVTGWKAADHLVEAAERGGFDDRWPRIAEGWLKLRIERRRFALPHIRSETGLETRSRDSASGYRIRTNPWRQVASPDWHGRSKAPNASN